MNSPLLTPSEMAEADRLTIAAGTPGVVLMERAGAAVAEAIRQRYPRQDVLILCGPGNNGGDGYVAGRLLRLAGWPVRLAALAAPKPGSDAAHHAALWQGPVEPVAEDMALGDGIVLDALFGAGLTRPLDPPVRRLLARVESQRLPLVAVDVPSGLDGATGEPLGWAPQADLTVTFYRAKPGHWIMPGRALCGRLIVADIGIDDAVLATIRPTIRLNDESDWRALLPRPGLASHKFTRGHLVIRGGGTMTGAARLSARAARRAGAGLVSLCVPENVAAIYAGDWPGTMVETTTWAEAIADRRRTAFLIGPGNGVDGGTRAATLAALATGRPVVLDADALSCFSGDVKILVEAIAGPVILTPHVGEFARLFKGTGVVALAGRLAQARAAAAWLGATVVLKGADTIIAHPSGQAAVEGTAPPTLATAGSGDVLAGILAALLAQGMPAFEAARAAVGLHAAAGRQAGRGAIAEDLIEFLRSVI
ncbi:NAD(P)H-hydrate dehydratase [Lacibacterium aquatile]|uniref:Bifunctional NAD(P)H-hydrate repair enzyme n=1 Tax=Lacibacterium aquatile TaxID=1168082 RepID=A0ABW5DJN7_9PROT